eukprot:TRINITY_DN681_c0_g1_i2.p1 TRINITY_DN681_c0_g1~~TRINITY_DN681_c0_g1_i2.p1  ORF type:complete len:708 (+),score=229.45 TRINITY_DN681_c0_g1_i2:114-2126(+)
MELAAFTSQAQTHEPFGSNRPTTFADFSSAHHDLLSDVISRTSNDSVKLTLANLLKLIQASAGEGNDPPVNFFIGSVSFQGEAREEAAALRARVEVSLLREKWTAVPLFPDSIALVASHVSFKSTTHGIETSKENPFSMLLQDTPRQNAGAKEPVEVPRPTPPPSSYCIGVVQKSYVLVALQPGTYVVDMELLVPYATSRKTGFVLAVPKAVQGEVSFRVNEKDVLIKVDPSLFSKTSSGGGGEGEPKSFSAVTSRCPPTHSLSVQWTENMGTSEIKVPQKVEVSSTVEQKNLISVGEGMVIIRSLLSYTITSGQMSLFEIEIDNRLKVIQVEGLKHIPVKRWEVDQSDERGRRGTKKLGKQEAKPGADDAAASASGKARGNEDYGTSILKVWLDYGLEDSYDFTVTSEMSMGGTSCTVEIAPLSCLVNREVVRDKGYLAVEARTNVEVEEGGIVSGLAMVDISEIPDALFSMATNPLLLGYKFLLPQYRLSLDVKKHADVGVLIAVVDNARFTATYTEAGAMLYRLQLQVRNTQKQYVRISVPDKAFDIWSTMVADRAVKPAMDSEGRVMIPLQKASKADASKNDTSFIVEFIYYVKHQELRRRGTLELPLPFCDIPVNYLSVQLFLPEVSVLVPACGIDEHSSTAVGGCVACQPTLCVATPGGLKTQQ